MTHSTTLPTLEQPRCATCRHWDNATPPWPARCNRAGYMGSTPEPEPMELSDPGGLYTLPTFGCVLHEPLTTPPMEY